MTTVPGPKCQTSDPNVNWLIPTLLHFLLKQKRKKKEGESLPSNRIWRLGQWFDLFGQGHWTVLGTFAISQFHTKGLGRSTFKETNRKYPPHFVKTLHPLCLSILRAFFLPGPDSRSQHQKFCNVELQRGRGTRSKKNCHLSFAFVFQL